MNAHFTSLSSFLAMGGYGFYVWFAYSSVFIVLVLLVGHTFYQRRRILRELKQQAQQPSPTIIQPRIIYESQT